MVIKKIKFYYKWFLIWIHYLKRLSFKKESKGEIIICFDGIFSHGGLVDRLKGIISFYEISKRLDYNFFIHFNSPFNLKDFLVPSKLFWIKEKVYYNPLTSNILYLMNDFNSNPYTIIKNSNKNRFIVYSNIDYLDKILDTDIEKDIYLKWSENYNALFKPSFLLESKLKTLLSTSKKVVFHTRFTTLLGDFKDTTKLELKESEKIDLIKNVLVEINKKVASFEEYEVFILSDSIYFLNYIKENTPYRVLDGVPKHIDLNDNDIESDLKTFIDFYFMSSCEFVFLVQLPLMYNSNFSKFASIVGNVRFEKLITSTYA
ncbi:hypothetical protein FNB79_09400 [Formosa sediminum]|uniref:Uncharacterized protein n=1 Tax=Formosa sediminum TaxID=2594004 RepID=A0A516GRP7_9FLAO|nr:hypothetical protein [Formosa sediminum]QDO94183.1 hypothetical protein FNB79_09400 [Formosa sediminum]